MPCAFRPAAASRPRSPPPITTARPPFPADPRQASTGDRNDERQRARRDQELIVLRRYSVGRHHTLGGSIDVHDLAAAMQGDGIGLIPGGIMDQDVVVGLFPGQHGREHDAIVVDARLGAENGDVVSPRSALEELLQHTAGGHAVADNDQLFGHRGLPARVKSSKAPPSRHASTSTKPPLEVTTCCLRSIRPFMRRRCRSSAKKGQNGLIFLDQTVERCFQLLFRNPRCP